MKRLQNDSACTPTPFRIRTFQFATLDRPCYVELVLNTDWTLVLLYLSLLSPQFVSPIVGHKVLDLLPGSGTSNNCYSLSVYDVLNTILNRC